MDAALTRYERAKLDLEHYRQQHEEVAAQLATRESEVTRALKGAKDRFIEHREVLGDQYGIFSVQKRRAVDADKLVGLFPDAIALVKHAMTMEELDNYVASGTIPQEIAEECITLVDTIKAK